MQNNSQLRPRLTTQELELIDYALLILNQLCASKLKEREEFPYELKKLARIVRFTGNMEAFRIIKPYKQYVEAELKKDVRTTHHNSAILRRRIEGLLNGRKLHSRTFYPYITSGTKSIAKI